MVRDHSEAARQADAIISTAISKGRNAARKMPMSNKGAQGLTGDHNRSIPPLPVKMSGTKKLTVKPAVK